MKFLLAITAIVALTISGCQACAGSHVDSGLHGAHVGGHVGLEF